MAQSRRSWRSGFDAACVGGDEINRNRRRRTGERILIRFRAESLGLQKEERKVGDDRLQFLNSLVDTTMHTIFQRNKEHGYSFLAARTSIETNNYTNSFVLLNHAGVLELCKRNDKSGRYARGIFADFLNVTSCVSVSQKEKRDGVLARKR